MASSICYLSIAAAFVVGSFAAVPQGNSTASRSGQSVWGAVWSWSNRGNRSQSPSNRNSSWSKPNSAGSRNSSQPLPGSPQNSSQNQSNAGDSCILTKQYPYDSVANLSSYMRLNKTATRTGRTKREVGILLSRARRSTMRDFVDRHYIPLEMAAKGGKGGRGTDWTEVMSLRGLNLPHRRAVKKHTFVNFEQRKPRWTYRNTKCVHMRDTVETEDQFQTWQLIYNGTHWAEDKCMWTPIAVALDFSGGPVHMAGPSRNPAAQRPCDK